GGGQHLDGLVVALEAGEGHPQRLALVVRREDDVAAVDALVGQRGIRRDGGGHRGAAARRHRHRGGAEGHSGGPDEEGGRERVGPGRERILVAYRVGDVA